MAGRGPDEGRAGGLPGSGRGESFVRPKPGRAAETRDATGGAPEGARAGHTARGHRRKVPKITSVIRRSAPSGGPNTRAKPGTRTIGVEHPRTGVPRRRESAPRSLGERRNENVLQERCKTEVAPCSSRQRSRDRGGREGPVV